MPSCSRCKLPDTRAEGVYGVGAHLVSGSSTSAPATGEDLDGHQGTNADDGGIGHDRGVDPGADEGAVDCETPRPRPRVARHLHRPC